MSQQTLSRPAGYARARQVGPNRIIVWGTHSPALATLAVSEQIVHSAVSDSQIASAYRYYGDPSLALMEEPWPEHLYSKKATQGWTPWLGVIT